MRRHDSATTAPVRAEGAIWWSGTGFDPGARGAFRAPIGKPRAGACLALALVGVALPPCALAAWIRASRELGRVQAGELTDDGLGTLVAARFIARTVTMLALALLVCAAIELSV